MISDQGTNPLNTTTILIVDDHPMMRTALRIALEDEADLTVVGEAGTVAEGRRQAIALKPDLILLDLYLPDGSGLDLIHFRNEQLPGTRVLMMSSSNNEKDIMDSVQAGADSYLVKDSPPEQLLLALRTVLAGESFLTPGATGILLKQLRLPQPESKTGEPLLSVREKEILHHLAGGASSAEIANTLHITESTLRTHLQHILGKLDLQNRGQTVIYAVKNHL
jgi:two-component system nitrate/nitrite response regulator NarL